MATTTGATIGKFSKPTIDKASTMMRGAIDYTNPKLFNLYESGYSFLMILSKPTYIEKLSEDSASVKTMFDLFCWILEYEFRGIEGIDDVTAENLEFTDGINTINTIGKITKQSAAEITMTFTERSGLALTKFVEFYLSGIKDPRTQAKTYHGLIKAGKLKGGFEHEVFQLLYIVTDNTMLGLEKAFLLANAWPSKAETSILNTTKGEIEKKEISMPWQCFVLDGEEVDELAVYALISINEVGSVVTYYDKALGKPIDNSTDKEDATNPTPRAVLNTTLSRLNGSIKNAKEGETYDAIRKGYKVVDGNSGTSYNDDDKTTVTTTV